MCLDLMLVVAQVDRLDASKTFYCASPAFSVYIKKMGGTFIFKKGEARTCILSFSQQGPPKSVAKMKHLYYTIFICILLYVMHNIVTLFNIVL